MDGTEAPRLRARYTFYSKRTHSIVREHILDGTEAPRLRARYTFPNVFLLLEHLLKSCVRGGLTSTLLDDFVLKMCWEHIL